MHDAPARAVESHMLLQLLLISKSGVMKDEENLLNFDSKWIPILLGRADHFDIYDYFNFVRFITFGR